jgi:hypothetical protein
MRRLGKAKRARATRESAVTRVGTARRRAFAHPPFLPHWQSVVDYRLCHTNCEATT